MSGRVEFEVRTQTERFRASREERPARVLVLGDFSGRSSRGLHEIGAGLAERPVVPLDADNFEDVMFRMAPRLHLPAGSPAGPGMAVDLKALEDLHPDSLYDKLEPFRALRETRRRLLDPATAAEAVASLKRAGAAGGFSSEQAAPTGTAAAPAESDSSTLQRLLGKQPARRVEAGPGPVERLDLTKIVQAIVGPYVVAEADPQQAELVAAVDAAIGEQMRRVLHHPAFQALESAWRSLHGLVSSLEANEGPELFVLDVTVDELAADLSAAVPDTRGSGLYTSLVDRGVRAGGPPWSLILGNYGFGASAKDLGTIARLGELASQAGGPFLAAARPSLLSCRSLVETPDPEDWTERDAESERRWSALRRSGAARWVGLTLPRLLLRLPYGAKNDAVDRFEFEELSTPLDHDSLLWGNPAFASARLLTRGLEGLDRSGLPGGGLEIDDLPAHVFQQGSDDEATLAPCAEVCLGERATTAILERGLMVLQSYRDRNAVRLAGFQSLADPPAKLAGPWTT